VLTCGRTAGWLLNERSEFLSYLRVISVLLACSALMAAGTAPALARADSVSNPSATAVAHVGVAPDSVSHPVSAAETARAAQLLGTSPTQVAWVPVCYYVYRYVYYCSGGRCVYVYRYVYVCN
jgi:hypothetical protein